MVMLRAVLLAALASACGGHGSYPAGTGTTPHAIAPKGGIADAGLPYQILDARTGHQVDEAAFWGKLASARAVCVGEEHPNPHHHWVQLEVVRRYIKVMPPGGAFGLGMEMFQRPFQGILDDFAAKKIDDAALRSRSGWEERWGYDYALYGPIFTVAVDAHAHLLALNASKELTKKIVHHGLESLTPEERAQVPELKLDDAAHRAWFDSLMEEMGGSSAHSAKPKDESQSKDAPPPVVSPHGDGEVPEMPSADRIYTVQVTWDETMADTGAAWLNATPNGHLIILAGNGHCHDSAIVNRMKRRGIADAISVRTVIDDGQGGVAEALAKPQNDYLMVLELPADAKAKAAADRDK